jgi:hypothetical protein
VSDIHSRQLLSDIIGSFGVVFKGEYKKTDVAIKQVASFHALEDDQIDAFKAEAEIMQ